MKLTKEQFVENVISAAKSIDISISLEQANKLYMYKDMLVEWNERINLTAITDDEEIIVKHIIDSLYVVKFINEGSKIIDVGTGAGLSGIIIAIYFKSWSIPTKIAEIKRYIYIIIPPHTLNSKAMYQKSMTHRF